MLSVASVAIQYGSKWNRRKNCFAFLLIGDIESHNTNRYRTYSIDCIVCLLTHPPTKKPTKIHFIISREQIQRSPANKEFQFSSLFFRSFAVLATRLPHLINVAGVAYTRRHSIGWAAVCFGPMLINRWNQRKCETTSEIELNEAQANRRRHKWHEARTRWQRTHESRMYIAGRCAAAIRYTQDDEKKISI